MLRSLSAGLLILILCGLITANASIYKMVFAPHELEARVLAVGPVGKQRTASLIYTPHRKIILIDTGPDASILRALGTALPEWQRSIDAVILTSWKSSMRGGLPDVSRRYHVSTVVSVGTQTAPYGSQLDIDAVSISIVSPGVFDLSYGSTTLSISSSTPVGKYVSDGTFIARE